MVKNIIKIKSKKGWVKIMEVFVAILILAGVLFVLGNKSSSDRKDFQEGISKKEIAILRDIELNGALRDEILNVNSDSLPVEWESFDSGLQGVKDRIIELTPKNVNCQAKLCTIEDICTLNENSGKEIYAESVLISANIYTYSPRELKLFCMEK